jgi:hypothetical protein
MIAFTCPDCGARISVTYNAANKRGRCPKCHEVITVPAVTAGPPGPSSKPKPPTSMDPESDGAHKHHSRRKDDEVAQDVEPKLPRQTPNKKVGLALAFGGIAGLVACVTLAVVITIVVMRKADQHVPPPIAQEVASDEAVKRQQKVEADARAAEDAADERRRDEAAANAKAEAEAQAKAKVERDRIERARNEAKTIAEAKRKAEEDAARQKVLAANAKLSRANFDKIKPVMYLPDVVALLGPSSSEERNGDYLFVTWKSQPLDNEKLIVITVRFRGGRTADGTERWYYNGAKSYDGP